MTASVTKKYFHLQTFYIIRENAFSCHLSQPHWCKNQKIIHEKKKIYIYRKLSPCERQRFRVNPEIKSTLMAPDVAKIHEFFSFVFLQEPKGKLPLYKHSLLLSIRVP